MTARLPEHRSSIFRIHISMSITVIVTHSPPPFGRPDRLPDILVIIIIRAFLSL